MEQPVCHEAFSMGINRVVNSGVDVGVKCCEVAGFLTSDVIRKHMLIR